MAVEDYRSRGEFARNYVRGCGWTASEVERGRSGDRLSLIGCESHLSLLQRDNG